MPGLLRQRLRPIIIQSKKVSVIGYGSQGHAQACNLKDSGVDIIVGLRTGSSSVAKAEAHGLKVLPVAEAVAQADLVMILTPDEFHGDLYKSEIEPNIKQGATLAFSHGFSIHYNQVVPRADLDVIMIAPKAPGHTCAVSMSVVVVFLIWSQFIRMRLVTRRM